LSREPGSLYHRAVTEKDEYPRESALDPARMAIPGARLRRKLIRW
jgi:hypothetical protein